MGKGWNVPGWIFTGSWLSVGDLGVEEGWVRSVNSGETKQAWIPSSPSTLGDLRSLQFPSWPSPQSVLSPVNGECLGSSHPCWSQERGRRNCWQVVWAGRGTPAGVQAMGGGHLHPTAYLEASSHLSTPCVQMMRAGLCSRCSLRLECPSFPPAHAGHWLPPTGMHWHHLRKEKGASGAGEGVSPCTSVPLT